MSGRLAAENSAPPVTFRLSSHDDSSAHCIHWRHWSSAAFHEATSLDKPIFLLISSSWCQWCHLMDETTLAQPSIITILNRDYIPVRVDSDLRPDVNQRYNQNGWPSIALLTPQGEVLWGGVYMPPEQLLYVLGYMRRYYSEHRHEIRQQTDALQELYRQQAPLSPDHARRHELSSQQLRALLDLPDEAVMVLRDLYDHQHGGFSIHPQLKFPHPEALELLVVMARQGQPDTLDMVVYSLEQMVTGGLWDKEEGGFFRYSAACDWGSPHTEKLLDENAAMLQLILHVAESSGQQRWYDLAHSLVHYINTTLWQPDIGVFSGSQCADVDYYTPDFRSRASRQAPAVDTTVYASWNARMISAYLQASEVLEMPELASMAVQALDWLCTHMMHSQGSICHYFVEGQAELPGQLADQIWMIRALLDAYDLYQQRPHLENAIALMHFACQELLDEDSGLFYDYPASPHAQGRLALREQPLMENALAAACLLRMAEQSKRENLRRTGLRVLLCCRELYRQAGIQGASYACVVAQAIAHNAVQV